MSRADRALYGQRENPARSLRRNRSARVWRRECALHLGENPERPNELGIVRPDAARNQCSRNAGKWIRRARRRLFPNLGIQQSRERGGSRAPSRAVEIGSTSFRCDLPEARNIAALGKKSAWPKRNKICSSFTASVF